MAVEYLLVTYPEDRDVLADGDRVGVTNHTILITSNEYTISLGGDGYEPTDQDVVVSGTSIMRPLVVAFRPVGVAAPSVTGNVAVRAAAVAGDAGGVPDAAGLSKPAARTRSRKPADG